MAKKARFTVFNELFRPVAESESSTAIFINDTDKAGNQIGVTVESAYSADIEIEISTDNVTFALYKAHTISPADPPPINAETIVGGFSPTLTASAGKWIRAKCQGLDDVIYSTAVQIPV